MLAATARAVRQLSYGEWQSPRSGLKTEAGRQTLGFSFLEKATVYAGHSSQVFFSDFWIILFRKKRKKT